MGGMMGGGGVDIPQRDLGSELGQILKFLPKFGQADFQLASKFSPKFSELDLTQAQKYAPQYLDLNLGQLQKSIAGQPILAELNKQAQSDLALGGNISPAEAYRQDQATRARFAASGTTGSNPSIFTEALNREQYGRQRLNERRAFAGQVQQMGTSNAAQMGALWRPGGSFAPYQAGIGIGQAVTNPLLQYGSDLFSSNQSAAGQESIAGANKSAGTAGGIMSTIGSIAGAAAMFASDQRLKKKIKDTGLKTIEGIPIKEGEYKTDPEKKRFRFVMAQDVEKKVPQAVSTDSVTGMKFVDYSLIDAPFHEIRKRKAA
jgi:hypothetical protein